jgi:hypothetical protein
LPLEALAILPLNPEGPCMPTTPEHAFSHPRRFLRLSGLAAALAAAVLACAALGGDQAVEDLWRSWSGSATPHAAPTAYHPLASTTPTGFTSLVPGLEAPDFTLRDLDGRKVRWKDFQGKLPVVIEFGSFT